MSDSAHRIRVLRQRLIAANDVVNTYRSRNLFMLHEIWALQRQFGADRRGPDHQPQTGSRHWKWYAKRTLQFIDDELRMGVTNDRLPMIFPVKLLVEPVLFRNFSDDPQDGGSATSLLAQAINEWFEPEFPGYRHRIGMFLENERIWVALLTIHGTQSHLYILDYRYRFYPNDYMPESRMTYRQRLFNFLGGQAHKGLRTFLIRDQGCISNSGAVPNSRDQFERTTLFIKIAIANLDDLEAGEHCDFVRLCEVEGTNTRPLKAESF
ncbi:hypothetical protein N431DRAFT_438984 [Stipitochalara longipes BDJ]|nr:hypothetical protein N431DRAFT_438984 [Stipitochalara longipes BDJ]